MSKMGTPQPLQERLGLAETNRQLLVADTLELTFTPASPDGRNRPPTDIRTEQLRHLTLLPLLG
jgi:hypothetical protein